MRVVIFVAVAVLMGLGLWFAPQFMSRARFAGFPGVYICEEFGLPDNEHNLLKVDEALSMFGVKDSQEVLIGKLKPIENSKSRARLEISTELVHQTTFTADPFADYLVEGIGGSIVISATREQKFLFSRPCFRK